MDNLLHRLNLSVRLLKGEGKHTLAQYIAGQLETPVSYTHLDVYKRQRLLYAAGHLRFGIPAQKRRAGSAGDSGD